LGIEQLVGQHYIARLSSLAIEQETTLNHICAQALNSNVALLELIGLLNEAQHDQIWVITTIVFKILASHNLLNAIDLEIIETLRLSGAPESLLQHFVAIDIPEANIPPSA
jgi:hypothetical protein